MEQCCNARNGHWECMAFWTLALPNRNIEGDERRGPFKQLIGVGAICRRIGHQCHNLETPLTFYFFFFHLKKWAHVYRKGMHMIAINTNNGLERQHETLKHCYLDGYKNCLLSEMISILHHGFFPDTFKKYMEQNLQSCEHYRKYAVEVPLFLRNRPREFISHVMQRYFSSLDESDIVTRDEEKGIFEIRSESDKKLTYTISLGEGLPTCCCKDWKKFLLPCKHMCAIFRLTAFKWERLDPAYTQNPLFVLDNECFKSVKFSSEKELEFQDRMRSSLSQTSSQVIQGLPPRRRKRRTVLIRNCVQSLKRLQDSVYNLDDEDYLMELDYELKKKIVEVGEKQSKEQGLILLHSPKKIDVVSIKDLPQRKYGKSKHHDLLRFGTKADQIKEDVWESVAGSEEAGGVLLPENPQSIWIKINKFNLTLKDMETILQGEWLDDNIINASQFLLKEKCVDVSGFIDTLILTHSEVQSIDSNHIIQIHHVGAHWLVSQRVGPTVTIYDSMAVTSFSENLKKQLIKLYRPLFVGENEILDVRAVCCQKQKGSNDCGLFAIANALALVEGINLRNIDFLQAEMRKHLVSCFEKGQLTMFPYETKKKNPRITKVKLTTFCTCKLYKSEGMIECSVCKAWYHFSCVNINKGDKCLHIKKKFFCPFCSK